MLHRISEAKFLETVKKEYRYLFASNFCDLRKSDNQIRIYERVNFPAWEEVESHFGANTSVLVDRYTDKVFVIDTGFHAYFLFLLYAHANDLNVLNNKTIVMVTRFISDGQGYLLCLECKKPAWFIGDVFLGDENDDIILRNQDNRLNIVRQADYWLQIKTSVP